MIWKTVPHFIWNRSLGQLTLKPADKPRKTNEEVEEEEREEEEEEKEEGRRKTRRKKKEKKEEEKTLRNALKYRDFETGHRDPR